MRDRMRCSLAGESYEEGAVVAVVDMGTRQQAFRRCPWGPVMQDRFVVAALNTYWLAKEQPAFLGATPAVLKNPQALEAVAVIGNEHGAIDTEQMKHARAS